MTALLPTTLLSLLIASPVLIWAAMAWRDTSARVDEGLRIPGSDDELCTQCTQKVATQPEDGGLCIECWILRPAVVPGGVRSLCVSCGAPDDDLLARPDGGAGGVCRTCEAALR